MNNLKYPQWLIFSLAMMICPSSGVSQDKNGSENSEKKAVASNVQAKREAAFAKKMTGATLVGTFTFDGKLSEKPAQKERYELAKVKKVGGNKWLFNAKIKYGKTDIQVPVLIDMFWADDTPVVSMTNLGIPGLGSGFSCRVLFYENRYAGTWQHNDVGGHMSGTIEENKELQSKRDAIPELNDAKFKSSLDQSDQPYRYWAPDIASKEKTPILVFLHSWSGNYKQDNSDWLSEASQRNWIYLHPDFRGANNHPDACGSALARQDVLDSLEDISKKFQVDPERIYLAGSSGGGHMTMLMAAYHPNRFSAASAWVGITDLAAWYRFHAPDGKPKGYALMTAKSMGGAPGASPEVDEQYRERSPVFHLQSAVDLPLDILTGIHDGHTGSVPVDHSLNAFNVLAKANGTPTISDEDINLLLDEKSLKNPQKTDLVEDSTLGRKIYLRRKSGKARVTIFEGSHEDIPSAAVEWLARQKRKTN